MSRFSGISQKFEWVVNTIIDNVDEIMVEENKNNLITIKKNNKYGIINYNSEIIVPPNYERIKISNYGIDIYCYNGRDLNIFDADGYELTHDSK